MAINVQAARAGAVFVSTLEPSSRATVREIRQVITSVVRAHGCKAVAARVAQEYGDHPDTAARRMEWARYIVAVTYPPRHRHTRPYPWCQRCWYTPERVAEIHAKVRQAKAAARNEPPQQPQTADEVLAAITAGGVR